VQRRVELVDQGERVAGGLRDDHHLPPDVVLVPAIAEGVEDVSVSAALAHLLFINFFKFLEHL
jgi:hypothetical protein